jgi:hypothetical protein
MDRIKPTAGGVWLDYISYPIPGVNILNHADRYVNGPDRKWLKFGAGVSALSVYNDMFMAAYSDSFLSAYGTIIERLLDCLK